MKLDTPRAKLLIHFLFNVFGEARGRNKRRDFSSGNVTNDELKGDKSGLSNKMHVPKDNL
jgi:hypothetical protein